MALLNESVIRSIFNLGDEDRVAHNNILNESEYDASTFRELKWATTAPVRRALFASLKASANKITDYNEYSHGGVELHFDNATVIVYGKTGYQQHSVKIKRGGVLGATRYRGTDKSKNTYEVHAVVMIDGRRVEHTYLEMLKIPESKRYDPESRAKVEKFNARVKKDYGFDPGFLKHY